MKTKTLSLAILAVLSAQPAAFAQDAPPTLTLPTMLFQMLSEGTSYANTLEPFDVNSIDIDFGDDGSTVGALDAMLAGN